MQSSTHTPSLSHTHTHSLSLSHTHTQVVVQQDSSDSGESSSETDGPGQPGSQLLPTDLGRRVLFYSAQDKKQKHGTLRYVGVPEFAEGTWCGIELDGPQGKNNGSIQGIRYFSCDPNRGVFVPISKVDLDLTRKPRSAPPTEKNRKMSAPPKFLSSNLIAKSSSAPSVHQEIANRLTQPAAVDRLTKRKMSQPSVTNWRQPLKAFADRGMSKDDVIPRQKRAALAPFRSGRMHKAVSMENVRSLKEKDPPLQLGRPVKKSSSERDLRPGKLSEKTSVVAKPRRRPARINSCSDASTESTKTIQSSRHSVDLSSQRNAELSSRSVDLSNGHSVDLSNRHSVDLSNRHSVDLSSQRSSDLSNRHSVDLSSQRSSDLSNGHSVELSTGHSTLLDTGCSTYLESQSTSTYDHWPKTSTPASNREESSPDGCSSPDDDSVSQTSSSSDLNHPVTPAVPHTSVASVDKAFIGTPMELIQSTQKKAGPEVRAAHPTGLATQASQFVENEMSSPMALGHCHVPYPENTHVKSRYHNRPSGTATLDHPLTHAKNAPENGPTEDTLTNGTLSETVTLGPNHKVSAQHAYCCCFLLLHLLRL